MQDNGKTLDDYRRELAEIGEFEQEECLFYIAKFFIDNNKLI